MKKIVYKLIYCLLLFVVIMNSFGGIISNATDITNANLVKIGEADYHLKYFNTARNEYTYAICSIVGHYVDGNFFPAYCLNSELPGVTDNEDYPVDINSVIERDDIWRVIKNGFPYKSWEEMGLDNMFDAFAVTKFAVYCVLGQSDLSMFYVEPDDEEAVAMLNVLTNLVNIGVNGTETRTNGNFKITKDGEIYEGKKYIVQKYTIVSNIDVKDISVEIVKGLPEGCYIDQIENSSFNLYIPKTKLDKKVKGEVKISGKSEIFPIFYGDSGNPGTQNYALTYDTFGEVSSNCEFELEFDNGSLKIVKSDEDTNAPISDVSFKLYKSDGEEIGTVTTDENGEAFFDKLYQGKYKLVEIETNEQYILDEKEREIEIFYNKLTKEDISNKHKYGDLTVYKVDKDDNKIAIENVEFDLFSDEFQKVIGTYKTDSNGKIEIKNLRIGNYKIIEKKTNTWYNLGECQEFEIKWNEQTKQVIQNELKKGQIKVIKIDKDNNEVKLKDVEFNVLNENGDILETIKTDENGEALTQKYPIKDYNKLVIQETKTNKGYKLCEESKTVELKENEITTVIFENEVNKEQSKIVKEKIEEKEVVTKEKEVVKESKIITKVVENKIEEAIIEKNNSQVKILPRTGY